jgi:hypothetical protein
VLNAWIQVQLADGAAAHSLIPVSLAKTRLRRKSRDKIGAFAGVSGPTVEKIAKVGINFRANARATGSDSADGSGLGRSGEKNGLVSMRAFRSALCYRIRYDLQQRFRRDRDLSDKRPIMRGNQQHRGGYAGRKQPHRN